MAERCIECRLNKRKVYFDLDKARLNAKTSAVNEQKTFCIYKKGKAISYTDSATAIAEGYDIIEHVSQHLQPAAVGI